MHSQSRRSGLPVSRAARLDQKSRQAGRKSSFVAIASIAVLLIASGALAMIEFGGSGANIALPRGATLSSGEAQFASTTISDAPDAPSAPLRPAPTPAEARASSAQFVEFAGGLAAQFQSTGARVLVELGASNVRSAAAVVEPPEPSTPAAEPRLGVEPAGAQMAKEPALSSVPEEPETTISGALADVQPMTPLIGADSPDRVELEGPIAGPTREPDPIEEKMAAAFDAKEAIFETPPEESGAPIVQSAAPSRDLAALVDTPARAGEPLPETVAVDLSVGAEKDEAANCGVELIELASDSTVYFDAGSVEAPEEALDTIIAFATEAVRCDVIVIVRGTADPSGGDVDNMRISWVRATNVIASIREAGFDIGIFRPEGVGAPGDADLFAADKLRRVEFVVPTLNGLPMRATGGEFGE